MGLEVSDYSRREAWLNSGWAMVCVCMCDALFFDFDSGFMVHLFRFYSLFCVYMIFYLDVYLRGNEEIGLCSPF